MDSLEYRLELDADGLPQKIIRQNGKISVVEAVQPQYKNLYGGNAEEFVKLYREALHVQPVLEKKEHELFSTLTAQESYKLLEYILDKDLIKPAVEANVKRALPTISIEDVPFLQASYFVAYQAAAKQLANAFRQRVERLLKLGKIESGEHFELSRKAEAKVKEYVGAKKIQYGNPLAKG